MLSNDVVYLVQKIELQRQSSDSSEAVRGHIVISLISRDRGSASPRNIEVSDFTAALSADDSNELPEGSVWIGFIRNDTLIIMHNCGKLLRQRLHHELSKTQGTFCLVDFSAVL